MEPGFYTRILYRKPCLAADHLHQSFPMTEYASYLLKPLFRALLLDVGIYQIKPGLRLSKIHILNMPCS